MGIDQITVTQEGVTFLARKGITHVDDVLVDVGGSKVRLGAIRMIAQGAFDAISKNNVQALTHAAGKPLVDAGTIRDAAKAAAQPVLPISESGSDKAKQRLAAAQAKPVITIVSKTETPVKPAFRVPSRLGVRNIGKTLKNYRDHYGVGQKKLADLVGVSSGTISNLETGRHVPTDRSLAAAKDFLVALR